MLRLCRLLRRALCEYAVSATCFQIEWSGTEMVALCSKLYATYDERSDKTKFSCKGLQKKQFTNPIDLYKEVLQTGKARSGTNYGIRCHSNTMFTYKQERLGLSYIYLKRKVTDNGISTVPLDV